MAYYDALIDKWPTLEGETVEEKLAAINGEMVPGPRTDVAISSVVGNLMLSGSYLAVADFSKGNFNGDLAHDAALMSAKMLVAQITIPNAPVFNMSDETNYTTISGMLTAMASFEGSGMSEATRDRLLALCETKLPWWQANGYSSPFSEADLYGAGILELPAPPEPIDPPIDPNAPVDPNSPIDPNAPTDNGPTP